MLTLSLSTNGWYYVFTTLLRDERLRRKTTPSRHRANNGVVKATHTSKGVRKLMTHHLRRSRHFIILHYVHGKLSSLHEKALSSADVFISGLLQFFSRIQYCHPNTHPPPTHHDDARLLGCPTSRSAQVYLYWVIQRICTWPNTNTNFRARVRLQRADINTLTHYT